MGALALTACTPDPLYRQESYVFGTRVEIQIYGLAQSQAQEAVAESLRYLDHLHNSYHAWQPSQLTAFNASIAEKKPLAVSAEMTDILEISRAFSIRSDNLFNPAIGHLISLWGFQQDALPTQVPDSKSVATLVKARPQMSDLHRDQNGRWYSTNPDVAVDLGGFLKGYALDKVAALLRSKGANNALINIGGNVMALGHHGQRPWKVALQHPREATPLATLDLADGEALGTSGDYQRFFEVSGRRYSHLIDPRNGWPAEDTQAISLLIPRGPQSGAWSDMASKPLFIDSANWRCRAQSLGLTQVLKVGASGKVEVSQDLARRLTFSSLVPPAVFTWQEDCHATPS